MTCVFALHSALPPPELFPSPFCQAVPHALAQAAAERVKQGLAADGWFATEGKMFGVLVVRTQSGQLAYLKAFSGMLQGQWLVQGFVPPLFDAHQRATFEREGALQVARLERQVKALQANGEWLALREEQSRLEKVARQQAEALAQRHRALRALRRARRDALDKAEVTHEQRNVELDALAQQSRADKAEQKRSDSAHRALLAPLQTPLQRHARRHKAAVRLLHLVCRHLMRRIHECYVLSNVCGETRGLRALFAPAEPPAGAGDCAAPKLLAYAHAHGLRPLALAEFWWGPPPSTGGRVPGAFYPACKGKCGPLVPFMLQGLHVAPSRSNGAASASVLEVVYEDNFVVVVNKPAGLLSVPGRGPDNQDSVLTRLQFLMPQPVFVVHRLDQDTSGLLLAAKSQTAYVILQRQFAARRVHKQYVAWVEGVVKEDTGVITLPLRLDVHDRPRQVVDPQAGKPALTSWTVRSREPLRTCVTLSPHTGRTHQLRVHCAHPQGLGAPIVGDRLYGQADDRLCLHAEELGFAHPLSGQSLRFRVAAPF